MKKTILASLLFCSLYSGAQQAEKKIDSLHSYEKTLKYQDVKSYHPDAAGGNGPGAKPAGITLENAAPPAREIELQKTKTHIQWRHAGDPVWTNLIAISEITGPQGGDCPTGETVPAQVFQTTAVSPIPVSVTHKDDDCPCTFDTSSLSARIDLKADAAAVKQEISDSLGANTIDFAQSDFTGTGAASSPLKINVQAVKAFFQSLPGYVGNGTKVLADNFTWVANTGPGNGDPVVTQLAAPNLTAAAVSSTRIDLYWTNVANESYYLLQISSDNSNWITIGTPGADATSFSSAGLSPATLYYYRIKAVGNTTNYLDSYFSTSSAATSSDIVVTAPDGVVLFPYNNGYMTESSGNYTGTLGQEAKGTANRKLAAGQNGSVYFKYTGEINQEAWIAFRNENNNVGPGGFIFGIILEDGTIKIKAMTTDKYSTGVAPVVNNYYRIEAIHTGATILFQAQTSTDAVNWTTIGSPYNFDFDGELFVNLSIYENQQLKVYGANLTGN